MSARDEILARVRAGVAGLRPARRAAAEARLQAPVSGPQPRLPADLVGRFRQRAAAQACTLAAVADWAAAPGAVASFMDQQGLAGPMVATPELAGLDWAGAGFPPAGQPAGDVHGRGSMLRFGAAVDADQVGISSCFCAIAETGTLMLLSGPQTPATVSLLPETHIALVEVARIVPTMEAAFARLRAEQGAVRGQLPRAVNFVSGPSRTGDIEQTIVLGAHGPCRVHLILIGE